MRMRTKKWARPELEKCDFYIREPKAQKGRWNSLFKSGGPIHLDLGCGKCLFLAEAAYKNRDARFIGIDISVDILGVGSRTIKKVFADEEISNIAIFSYNIERLDDVFSENEGIERIYVNFCNPWPKARAHKRRLTYTSMLNMYKSLLSDDGEIWFKTDNRDLYLASLRYFNEADFDIFFKTQSLDKCDVENYLSEHEIMFTEQGISTKAIRAKKKKT